MVEVVDELASWTDETVKLNQVRLLPSSSALLTFTAVAAAKPVA